MHQTGSNGPPVNQTGQVDDFMEIRVHSPEPLTPVRPEHTVSQNPASTSTSNRPTAELSQDQFKTPRPGRPRTTSTSSTRSIKRTQSVVRGDQGPNGPDEEYEAEDDNENENVSKKSKHSQKVTNWSQKTKKELIDELAAKESLIADLLREIHDMKSKLDRVEDRVSSSTY